MLQNKAGKIACGEPNFSKTHAFCCGFIIARQRVPALRFDQRGEVWRKKVAKGDVIVVPGADDLVLRFQ